MSRNRFITVPIDQEGIKDYDNGEMQSEHFKEYILDESEFHLLWIHKVFEIINKSCGLLIDDCESETITAEQLRSVYPAISVVKGVWLNAVDLAIKMGTCVCLDF